MRGPKVGRNGILTRDEGWREGDLIHGVNVYVESGVEGLSHIVYTFLVSDVNLDR